MDDVRNTYCVPRLKGLRVLVMGLGRFGGGVSVTRWLIGEGAVVTVTDQAGPQALDESAKAIADLPVPLHFGGHDVGDLDGTDLVVINPAVDKARSEFFREIVRRGIAWTTEMNFFCERCPSRIIGVTGSYGKSTTCAMLAAALRTAGDAEVYLGGNIGRSLLPDLPNMRSGDVVVLEMSNAQLEDLPRIGWAPPMAVITNLYPHHLDRYPTFSAYADAKLNIVRDPRKESRVVIGEIHPQAERMLDAILPDAATRVRRVKMLDPPVSLRVTGRHNEANAACALTVCDCLGLDGAVVREALASFKGLPHRLEHVRELDGVDYFNDSKATSPDATIAALESFDLRGSGLPAIVAIVGGRHKNAPLAECARALARVCRAVICVGESGPEFAEAIRRVGTAHQFAGTTSVGGPGPLDLGDPMVDYRKVGSQTSSDMQDTSSTPPPPKEVGHPPKVVDLAPGGVLVHEAATLEEAVRFARGTAKAGDIVLFSPGAPSFDAYPNFAVRGRHFVDLVNALR